MGFGGVNKEMENALNSFFQDQAALDGKCLVDYVQFDNHYETVFSDLSVDEAEALIVPRGSTALLDAIGRGTVELGKKLKDMDESSRPGKVLVVVVTDGHENASQEWDATRVKSLVTTQQDDYSWDYVFLGANIDAVAVGDFYGFKPDKSLTFNINDAAAVGATSAVLSAYTTTYRGGGNAQFSDEDRKKSMGS